MNSNVEFRIKSDDYGYIYFGISDIYVIGMPGKGCSPQHIYSKGKAYYLKEYFIMRNTHVYDKYGVAVFENDYVRYENDSGYTYTKIIFHNGAFKGENGVLICDMENVEVGIKSNQSSKQKAN